MRSSVSSGISRRAHCSSTTPTKRSNAATNSATNGSPSRVCRSVARSSRASRTICRSWRSRSCTAASQPTSCTSATQPNCSSPMCRSCSTACGCSRIPMSTGSTASPTTVGTSPPTACGSSTTTTTSTTMGTKIVSLKAQSRWSSPRPARATSRSVRRRSPSAPPAPSPGSSSRCSGFSAIGPAGSPTPSCLPG